MSLWVWAYEVVEAMSSVTDHERGRALITAMCAETSTKDFIVVPGDPKSKARPRLGKRGHVYTPSKPFETTLATILKTGGFRKRDGNVALGAVFFRPNYQRVDADNMLKLVLDAGTTAELWNDDSQVTALMAVTEYDPENPRTVIVIGDHESSLDRSPTRGSAPCQNCGQICLPRSNGTQRKFCSRECRYGPIRLDKNRPGQGRGRKGQPKARCCDCGKELSKRSYIRCRDCWKVARTERKS